MRSPANTKKSFTLVEMLLVTCLISVVGLALYHSLANGLKIWQYSNRYTAEEDVAIFFDKLTQDLHNAVDYSLIKFDGHIDKISFPSLVTTMSGPAGAAQTEYISQIGRVEYEFDGLRNTLLRRQAGYGQALADKFDPPRPLVYTVAAIKFSYLFKDSQQIVSKDRADGIWPTGVLVEVKFASNGEELNSMSKRINIPAGNEL